MRTPEGYVLIRCIGKGSHIVVGLMRNIEWNYCRAMGILDPNTAAKDDENYKKALYEQYLNACKVMLQLSHPNIVATHKVFTEKDDQDGQKEYVYVEMDYVKGQSLQDYLKQNKQFIPTEEVLRLAQQISSALAYCHKEMSNDDGQQPKKPKVFHNDIKPDNIIRRNNGDFVLLDFGLSTTTGSTLSDCIIHKRNRKYLDPKLEENGGYNEKSDIYSFGRTLFEILAGQPYSPDVNIEILDSRKRSYMSLHEDYQGDFQECNYPAWLEKVIFKCLAKSPKDRYADGTELYQDIMEKMQKCEKQPSYVLPSVPEAQIDPEHTDDEASDTKENLLKLQVSLHRWKKAAITLLFLLLIVGLGLIWAFNKEGTRPATSPETAWVDSLQREIKQLEQENKYLNTLIKNNSDEKVKKLLAQVEDLKKDCAALETNSKVDGKTAQQWKNDYSSLEKSSKVNGKTAQQWKNDYSSLEKSSKVNGKTAQQWKNDYNSLEKSSKVDGKTAQQWKNNYSSLEKSSKVDGKTAQQWMNDYKTLKESSKADGKTAQQWRNDYKTLEKNSIYEGHDAKYWFDYHFNPNR